MAEETSETTVYEVEANAETKTPQKGSGTSELVVSNRADEGETTVITTTTYDSSNASEDLGMNISDTLQLQDFVTKNDVSLTVCPLLLTVSGLPKSGKTTYLGTAGGMPIPTESTSAFTHHELVFSGFRRLKKIHKRNVDRYAGFQESILSAVKFHKCNVCLTNEFKHNSTFDDDELKGYAKQTADFLHHRFDEHARKSFDHKQIAFEDALEYGIGLVNVWDMAVEESTRSLLECFSVCFTKNYIWLFVSLERDVEKLHLPPEDVNKGTKCELWRPRIQYLLRTCLMSKRSKENMKVCCKIFATYSQKKDCDEKNDDERREELTAKLRRECKNAARQMKVQQLVDFNIVVANLREPKISLKRSIKALFAQTEYQESIPISWLFLCGSFACHKKFYMTTEELKAKAVKCKIDIKDDLPKFCKFFTSFGSIIDVTQIDSASKYVIVKPFEFLNHFNALCKREQKVGKGFVDWNPKNTDVMMDILDSVGFAVKLPALNKCFVQAFQVGEAITTCNPNAVQLTLGIDSPRINMQTEMLKDLLKTDSLMVTKSSENTNSIFVESEGSSSKVFTQLTTQGNVIEISICSIPEQDSEAIESQCSKIIGIVEKIISKKSADFGFNLKYQFALRCEGDGFGPGIAFNAYRKQHILPNWNICSKCAMKSKNHLQIMEAWNKALDSRPIPDLHKLNEDLYPGDLADLASSISKYPWKAIVMLADELKVKSHIQKPKEEKIRTWMVMEMLMEWEREYKHDKSPKKTLAQKLHVVSEKWGELNYEFNEDEPHPKFKQLARNLDIQVLTTDQRKSIEKCLERPHEVNESKTSVEGHN